MILKGFWRFFGVGQSPFRMVKNRVWCTSTVFNTHGLQVPNLVRFWNPNGTKMAALVCVTAGYFRLLGGKRTPTELKSVHHGQICSTWPQNGSNLSPTWLNLKSLGAPKPAKIDPGPQLTSPNPRNSTTTSPMSNLGGFLDSLVTISCGGAFL